MSTQASPFKRTTIIIMFAIGFAAFVGLLYGLGTGDRLKSGSNGQAHGASNSIVGYKALAELLRKTGTKVQYSRTKAAMDDPGLLILTPGPYADSEDLAETVHGRGYIGPTIVILAKWQVAAMPNLKRGWVARFGTHDAEAGVNLLEDIADVEIKVGKKDKARKRTPAVSAFAEPVRIPGTPVTMNGDYVRAIVRNPKNGEAMAAYVDDGGVYAQLDALEKSQISDEEEIDEAYFPIVLIADADLMNNMGMADRQTAKHALALINAVSAGSDGAVTFDLTYNGLGASENLLTLAFEPPFLSATICLIAAAMAAAWMAFNRFGPPVAERRSIDFGKTALVNNSAGFIGRMQREYLVSEPYAEMIRRKAAGAIGLPAGTDDDEIDRKLDELGESNGNSFTTLFRDLNRADNKYEVAERAAALRSWKKDKIG